MIRAMVWAGWLAMEFGGWIIRLDWGRRLDPVALWLYRSGDRLLERAARVMGKSFGAGDVVQVAEGTPGTAAGGLGPMVVTRVQGGQVYLEGAEHSYSAQAYSCSLVAPE